MPQHATLHAPVTHPDPTDFQARLLARLDEIIGLLDTLTTTLADRDDEDAYFLPDPAAMLLALDEDELPF